MSPISDAIAGDAAALLHRVQAEDGLDCLVGRDAVYDRLRRFAGLPADLAAAHGHDATLAVPGAHLWARLEAGRIAHIVIIAARTADSGAAAALAASHPCHRPLGELASGRGQLLPEPGEGPLAAVAHGLARRDPALCAVLAPLLDAAADAVLLPRVVLALADGGWVGLAQLMGHADGRRISLPVSLHGRADGVTLMHDALALAAAAQRPFWPD
jgi:hypothetical protein